MKFVHRSNGQPLAAEDLDNNGNPKVDAVALPCGKRALMTPCLTLPENSKRWLRASCAKISQPEANSHAADRTILVWPLIEAQKGRLIVVRSKKPPVEFIVQAPPYEWQWPSISLARGGGMEKRSQPLAASSTVEMGNTTRLVFHKENSDQLWSTAERYSPQTGPWQSRARSKLGDKANAGSDSMETRPYDLWTSQRINMNAMD